MSMLRYVFPALIWAASAGGALAQGCTDLDILTATTPTPPSPYSWELHQKAVAGLQTSTDLVVIGDTTALSWDTRMWARIAQVQNLAAANDSTQHVLFRLKEPALTKVKTKSVLVMVGTWNLTLGHRPCAIAAGVTAIVDRVKEIWPGSAITVLEIPPRGDGFKFRNDARRATNELIRKIPGISTVNIDEQITCRWTEPCPNYARDNLHFTPEGYRVLFNVLRDGWQTVVVAKPVQAPAAAD